jgi:hypothetical protein
MQRRWIYLGWVRGGLKASNLRKSLSWRLDEQAATAEAAEAVEPASEGATARPEPTAMSTRLEVASAEAETAAVEAVRAAVEQQ